MPAHRNEAELYETLCALFHGDEILAYRYYTDLVIHADVTRTVPEIILAVEKSTGLSDTIIAAAYYPVRAAFDAYKFDYEILVPGDSLWPRNLESGEFPVHFLYAVGNLPLLDKKCFALIGMHQPTTQGKEAALAMAKEAIEAGASIVSTLDVGMDSFVLSATLHLGRGAIVPLASPLHQCVPDCQRDQMVQMANGGGLLLTRFSPCAKAEKWHLVLRNRMLVDMCLFLALAEEKDGGPGWLLAQNALDKGKCVLIPASLLGNPSYRSAVAFSKTPDVHVFSKEGDVLALVAPKRRRARRDDYGQLTLF